MGSVKQDNGSALSGVSVSFAIYGSTVDNTPTDSSGDFSKSLNSLGIYTLTSARAAILVPLNQVRLQQMTRHL